MTLHKTYQKQVEAWKERFIYDVKSPIHSDFECGDKLLSSRHKDTIELIEAEIERKKQMRKREHGDTTQPNSYGLIVETLHEKRVYNSAIDEDIAYLEETIQKIRNTYNL